MQTRRSIRSQRNHATALLEQLEDRCLLSAVHHAALHPAFFHSLGGLSGRTITFSEAPMLVQTGLDTLASMDSLTAPTPDQLVFLGNSKGVETYSIGIAGTGSFTKLTVDATGTPIVAPTVTTSAFSDLATTNSTVTDEFTAIATALGLTAPAPTDTVTVLTASDLTTTYVFRFAGTTGYHHVSVTLDANGNPIGNAQLPLSVFSTDIQTGLTTNAPAGYDALATDATVSVRTLNGNVSYSATYTGTGLTPMKVTVDIKGALTTVPTTTTVQFSTLPPAASLELQTLATADGFVGMIDPTTNVRAYDEANGTIIFTIRVPVSKTNPSGTFTFNIQLSVDQLGNPTVPPFNGGDDHGGGCGGFGGFGGFGGIFGGIFGGNGGNQGENQGGNSGDSNAVAAIVNAFWHHFR